MENFSGDFREFDRKELLKLAQTDVAKQLFATVQATHSPQLQEAMTGAQGGDMTKAKELLQQLMENPQTKELLQQLMGNGNG